MRVYRLTLFGREIAALEINVDEDRVREAVADALNSMIDDDADDEESVMTGGSTHNFERDPEPLRADEHHRWEWGDRRRQIFGFGVL